MSRLMQLRLVAGFSLGAVQFGCNGERPSEPSRATHIEAVSPTTLRGTVASEVASAPTVLVTDQFHNPVEGIEVVWTSAGNGVIANTSIHTGAAGTATVGTWTLGTKAGPQTLRAVTATQPPASVVFTAVASPAATATITVLDSVQRAPVGSINSLRIRVADAFNNAIAAAPVTFEVESGGGYLVSSSKFTDSVGIAGAEWRIGAAGQNSVTVSVEGLNPTRFTTLAIQALSYYELEPMSDYFVTMSAWIALGEDGRFTTSIDGLRGGGEYTLDGAGIVFSYSDDFLSTLGATMDLWAYPYSLTQEGASITPELIIVRRCVGEDCYEADFTYRRRGH